MSWFEVDKSGLAAVLERRGKSFAVFELVQNAWDSGAKNVSVTLKSIEGVPQATLIVEDDSADGWINLDDAFTLFAKSSRAADPMKRGRFCMGEKLVLAMCAKAEIISTSGGVTFDSSGGRRRQSGRCRDAGTLFSATIRMTREELSIVESDVARLIPPAGVNTTYNGTPLNRAKPIKVFEARLPTEIADADGNLRKSMRVATIEAFPADGRGEVLEMGIPVCEAEWPWRLNVHQKIPLGMERDAITEAFRRALQVAAVNAMPDTIDAEQAAAPWASEALGDSRLTPEATKAMIVSRFGDRAVVAVPGDPMANAQAAANGCTVIHGGALSGDAWANVRKHEIVFTSSQAFPSPKPEDRKPLDNAACPFCGQPVS